MATTATTSTTTPSNDTDNVNQLLHDETDNNPLSSVVSAQLTSLDDTDCYASAWADALAAAASASSSADGDIRVKWGGRGRGGRGLSRRTFQRHDVIVENVCLEYANDPNVVATAGGGGGGGNKLLLNGASLKLLSSHVCAIVGRNGCGKSTLLRRIDAGKIPGFPPHLSTMYVTQKMFTEDGTTTTTTTTTPMEMLLRQHRKHTARTVDANRCRLEQLERELEELDMSSGDNAARVEELCEQISALEDENEEDESKSSSSGYDAGILRHRAAESLEFFGLDKSLFDVSIDKLSGGLRKKVMLASAWFCNPDILMLDEPTNHLDIAGIVQLRRLIGLCTQRKTTVVLVSHDVDLINDVPTDVIHFANHKLMYYPGNYRDFVGYKNQMEVHHMRQNAALEKQRAAMLNTIDNLMKQAAGKRGDKKKKRIAESRKKKLEKHGVERDEHGHRWTMSKSGTGVKEGSIQSIDAATRSKLSYSQLLKRPETRVAPVPDKAVQFVFRDTTCTWGEPLIMAMDVGHGYSATEGTGEISVTSSSTSSDRLDANRIVKKEGMLFDCIDLCIDEGSRTCILGANGSGKSTLLRILAGIEQPLEGKVHHALNVNVGFFHQYTADVLIKDAASSGGLVTPLSLLTKQYPLKTEQDLRGELTAFGLSPKQAVMNVKFLSGGERCRLCLVIMMLKNPHVLILDEPTNHLDVESVEALAYGIQKWNGTVILVSHDANLIRTIGGACYVLMEEEGKLRYIPDGIDSYLKAFTL